MGPVRQIFMSAPSLTILLGYCKLKQSAILIHMSINGAVTKVFLYKYLTVQFSKQG